MGNVTELDPRLNAFVAKKNEAIGVIGPFVRQYCANGDEATAAMLAALMELSVGVAQPASKEQFLELAAKCWDRTVATATVKR